MKRILKVILLSVFGLWPGALKTAENSSPGAVGAAKPVSIRELVMESLANNPELRFYEAEVKAARAGRKSAGLWPNPELSGELGRKAVRGDDLHAEGLAWSVAVLQPIEWPGRIGLRKAIANRDLELAELGLERFRSALAARVQFLALSWAGSRERAAAAREVADRMHALRETLLQRDPAGLTPLLETRVIEATAVIAQRSASETALAMRRAQIELNRLRGAPLHEEVQVGSSRLEFHRPIDAAVLLAMARTNNFDLRLRATELAQQGYRTELARNERFPTLSIGPSYSEERGGERERIVGLALSVPVPLWNRNSGNIEAAKARQLQAETSFQVALREAETRVLEAALSYDTKYREMQQWRPDAIQHFKEAAELADRHYRLGAVPISTYLELQKQYVEAVEVLLETQQAALQAAEQLQQLTGLATSLVTVKEVDR